MKIWLGQQNFCGKISHNLFDTTKYSGFLWNNQMICWTFKQFSQFINKNAFQGKKNNFLDPHLGLLFGI